jgi:hypothetical protein
MNRSTMASLLDFAVDAATRAGRLTLEYFGADLTIDRKADESPARRPTVFVRPRSDQELSE